MKTIVLLSSVLLMSASFAKDSVKLQDFAGSYKINSCNLGGLLKKVYLRNSPDLIGVEDTIKGATIEFRDGNYRELSVDLLEADGTRSSSFSGDVNEESLKNLNKGKIRWKDNNWGTRYFSETSLKGSKFCHNESSDQGEFCLTLNESKSRVTLKFSPNVGISFTCEATRL